MMRYTCQACEAGMHDLCSGKQPPPSGMMGGSECICKGDCKPRTMGKVVEDAKRMEAILAVLDQGVGDDPA